MNREAKTSLNGDGRDQECEATWEDILKNRKLIIAANRGPVTIHKDSAGEVQYQKGGGGLVTALTGLARFVDATWIASALTDEDAEWGQGVVPLDEQGDKIKVKLLKSDPEAYNGYYNVIANPLLWFLQHSMWDFMRSPTITRSTWQAWTKGYVEINRLFAQSIAAEIRTSPRPVLVMLQDYHLYLAPRLIRQNLFHSKMSYTLSHFIHIPWPGGEDWGFLPPAMRQAILDGLCAVDLLGFQTREDSLNFIRTCESYLPDAHVNYRHGRVWYRNHTTYVRDFPISIDVVALQQLAAGEEVHHYRKQLLAQSVGRQLIVRIDRTEPSKNIVRGFQAYEELFELYPEHIGKVQFLALLVPSRLKVEEYQNYLDELMAAAGRVNAKIGTGDWEPVRVLVGEDYPRAVAALQLYDVLLVNPIADGMNLVAKEGPVVNQKDGVLVLSERAGAQQQLGQASLVISPADIYDTATAIHKGLTLPPEERRRRATWLREAVEREDITGWLCEQLSAIARLQL